MANDFRRGIRIYLETSDFGKGIDQMAKKTKEYETELENLVKQSNDLTVAGKNTGTEWNKLQKQIKNKTAQLQKATTAEGKYKQQLDETNKVLNNLSGATHNQLIKVRNQLRKEMRDSGRDTDKYKNAKEQLLRVERELAKAHQDLTSQIGCQGTAMGKLAGGINKYAGLLGGAISAVFGANFAFRRLVAEAARMDDVYSDVMKTTGMTRDQVLELNEVFKQMDTRTAREELNRLAYDAGKLGLSAREDILGFVEAGNQIRVAFGQELGDDAIKSIGKMSGVFRHSTRELQGLGLREMMLSTASAINELGMSSTANEQYMVQFAGRLGGVASQANIGMGAILGFASTLDQNMQKVEMAATALQKFILRTMSDPAEMARIAGLEVREFTELLSRDTNAAILQVLRALNEKGGFQQLIPVFDEMGLSGARAVGVLSALSKNVDEIERQQQIANRAMADGTSVTNEYSIKNNNLQAQLEKSRKAFLDLSEELGKGLLPIQLKLTEGMTHFLRILIEVPKWLGENKSLVFSLTTALIAYLAVSQ